ncbi:MAG: ABC transporter substrate-binding protein [Bacteriovoracales bacterium]
MKIQKIFSIILILFLTISCTKKVDQNVKVLNLAVAAEIKGLDPIFADDAYSGGEVARIYEGLLEYHYLKRPYTLIPNLAESMPVVSKDGSTYTFKIKQGVFFHNDDCFPGGKGRELKAQDFVYSIKRLADPKLQSSGWWLLQDKITGLDEWRNKFSNAPEVNYLEEVEGIKALDQYTVQFKLKKSFPQFLYSLAMPFTFVVAEEAVKKYGKEFINHPVGTGPFILPIFTQSNKITYFKNPTFRKKYYPSEASEEFSTPEFLTDAGKELPLVDKIEVNIIKESQPKWLNFQKGKIDYISIPKDNFGQAITPNNKLSEDMVQKGIVLKVSTALDIAYTAFNHDNPIFKNIDLRRAMSLATNPAESNRIFYNGTATVAQSIIPPGIAGYLKDFKNPYTGQNIEEAKKLLAKAGFPGGKGLPVMTYDTTATTDARQGGELFQREMAKIGINVEVVANPWPQLQEKINKRKVMLYGLAWSADYPDAENFLQLLYGPNKSPGANGSGYDDPEFNSLFKEAALMQDGPVRTALYEKLNRLAAINVPVIYGVHRQNYILKHGFLKNYMPSDFDHGNSQYLNIDLKEKIKSLEKL